MSASCVKNFSSKYHLFLLLVLSLPCCPLCQRATCGLTARIRLWLIKIRAFFELQIEVMMITDTDSQYIIIYLLLSHL